MIDKLAIYPGVRTYYNCYLTEGLQMKLGNNIENIYTELIKRTDELSSKKANQMG